MKNLFLLSLIGFIIITNSFAQIPNNSFESWTTVGTHVNPDNWGCLNDYTSTYSTTVFTCTKATNTPPQGTSYIKITSKNISGLGMVHGVAVCGTLNPVTRKPVAGFPYTLRSQKLTGKWQHMSASDQGYIDVLLSKWNSSLNKRDTIAYKHTVLGAMVMSWATFNITLNYVSGEFPDSAMIFCSASPAVAAASDYLWLDNLSFTGTVIPTGIDDAKLSENTTSVFPNPCSDILNLSLYLDKPSQVIVQVFDITGKMMKSEDYGTLNGANEKSLKVNSLSKGIYLLNIITGNNSVVKYFTVE